MRGSMKRTFSRSVIPSLVLDSAWPKARRSLPSRARKFFHNLCKGRPADNLGSSRLFGRDEFEGDLVGRDLDYEDALFEREYEVDELD